MDSEMSLCDLPGEMQNQIILRLHPSAAVALSQTSRHFHATVSLNRLENKAVKQFLEERKAQLGRVDGFLCCSCFCLKPRREFLKSQITKKRSKAGSDANKRACFECMGQNRQICPGNIVDIADGEDKRVYCLVCLKVRYRFCTKCRWCFGCVKSRVAKTYRKGRESESSCRDGMIDIVNECSDHEWFEAPPAKELFLSGPWDDVEIWDPDADGQWSP